MPAGGLPPAGGGYPHLRYPCWGYSPSGLHLELQSLQSVRFWISSLWLWLQRGTKGNQDGMWLMLVKGDTVTWMLGYPTLRLDLTRVPPSGPGWSTPHLDLARVPPIWTWLEYPLSGPGWGTPLAHLDLVWVPPPIWTSPGYPPSPLSGPGHDTRPLGVN